MRAFFEKYLDPSERMSEVLFGLIMTLTFTLGASLVIEEGPDATRELLIGVVGCNIAWGLIDGLLYIFNAMFSRGAPNRMAYQFKKSGRLAVEAKLNAFISDTFHDTISNTTRDLVSKETIDHIATFQPKRVRMTRDDLYGAIASFILVALTAVPAVTPFLLIDDRMTALRVSNFLMIALLYLIGRQWASYIDANRHKVGLAMAVGGLVIVQLTILLGG